MKKLGLFALCLGWLAVPGIVMAQIGFTQHLVGSNFDGAFFVYSEDLDKDGDMDVLGAAVYDNSITWWENLGEGQFEEHVIDSSFGGAVQVLAVDLDGDQDFDVLGCAFDDDEIAWWENDGSQGFTKHTIRTGYHEARDAFAADLDGDGDVDVVGTSQYDNLFTWWENDGNQNFTEHTIAYVNFPLPVYAMDLDGDGDNDLLLGIHDEAKITWWENTGGGQFLRHIVEHDFYGVWDVFPVDLDFDGDIDVLGASQYVSHLAWWENDGNMNFTRHDIPGYPTGGARSVCTADLDRDGDLDVLGAFDNNNMIAWYENDGNQNFTEHILTSNFWDAFSVYAADLDGDRNPDILGAGYDADQIVWWENQLGVSITLTPPSPIVIPAEGGSFDFSITLKNNAHSLAVFDAWCDVLLPDSTIYSPVMGPVSIQLPANSQEIWYRTQTVPAAAPAGFYRLRGFVGEYSTSFYDQDEFSFIKLGVGTQGLGFDSWANVLDPPYGGETANGEIKENILSASPNPFNVNSVISYQLAAISQVSLKVYDTAGRLVSTLADGVQTAGHYNLTFDGSKLSSGLYLVKMDAGSYTAVQKLMLLK